MQVLNELLSSLKNTSDRIVIVSSFTQTLDAIEALLRTKQTKFVRLDGATSSIARHKVVTDFNDHSNSVSAMLLSAQAGGCGLNLIGGNRLILFEPNWNPAVDKQVLARVWRQGQKKHVWIYRFLLCGSIDEKIFIKQEKKGGLASCIGMEETSDFNAAAAPQEGRI